MAGAGNDVEPQAGKRMMSISTKIPVMIEPFMSTVWLLLWLGGYFWTILMA
jgi:hypothetical protein